MPTPLLVTQTEFSKAEAVFRAAAAWDVRPVAADEASVAAAVLAGGCRAVIVGVAPYRGPLYEALGRTGGAGGALIARFGVGHDSIDKPLARQQGIVITNTPGALDQSVAEYTLWLLGALARRVAACDRCVRAGRFTPQIGVEVRGRTLGLLGFGAIGRCVGRMAHLGLGMRVVAADCRSVEDMEWLYGCDLDTFRREHGLDEYTTDVDAVLAAADFVSVHLPSNGDTRHFINASRLARMQPGAMLINTARGAIVDEAALYDALVAGRLGGAALDVFETEPYAPVHADKDLRTLDNVVLTPHVASNTQEANGRMAEMCLANVEHFFAGRIEKLNQVQ